MSRLAELIPGKAPPTVHYSGFIVNLLRVLTNDMPAGSNKLTIDEHRYEASGLHQARVRLDGDPTEYRLVLAPVDGFSSPLSTNERISVDG